MMTTWYLLSIPFWIVILITAGARLADMGRDEWTWVDHAHRMFLSLSGAAAGVMLATPFLIDAQQYVGLSWRGFLLSFAWAGTWMTKRDIVPWWDFILGVHRKTEDWKGLSLQARAGLEMKALRDSFRPRRKRAPLAGPKGELPG